MSSFDLLENYIKNPEALIRRTKTQKSKQVLASALEEKQTEGCSTPIFETMADKTLREFPAPSAANIRTRPIINIIDNAIELRPALINMVQANQFCRKAHEDASAHLQHFLEICSTFTIKGVTQDAILLCLFPFGKEKQWFYANKDNINSWAKCSNAFYQSYF